MFVRMSINLLIRSCTKYKSWFGLAVWAWIQTSIDGISPFSGILSEAQGGVEPPLTWNFRMYGKREGSYSQLNPNITL